MRKALHYNPDNVEQFIKKALHFSQRYDYCSYFSANNIANIPYQGFKNLLAFNATQIIPFKSSDPFLDLQQFQEIHKDWLIGHFGYDLKNNIEKLSSSNTDRLNFPDIFFYQPETVILWDDKNISIETYNSDPQSIIKNIEAIAPHSTSLLEPINEIYAGTSREEYIGKVKKLKQHIVEGDIYEINYCIDFHTNTKDFSPLHAYELLTTTSPTPFSVFHKFNNYYLICASPERFMKKEGQKLVSQPIKGTAKRGSNKTEDDFIKKSLRKDVKELAENMMIVDLVRNDLAKSSQYGTIKPEELFGIYSFHQLHQMISTITSTLSPEVTAIEAIKNAFPMGSMTGAPKIKVMELIEKYENNKRGLYSGAMGYFSPTGDFDFNVVIRSILYNASNSTLSFQVGSAITYDAIPEKEYEECLLKAKAILELLGNPTIKVK
ncbi:anthranilate synthase component I family protein [Fulvivirga sediminis]|uniref:Anthranilate synthase component I family protein n=1 Tax=Fulvivirga sediminis TaxID=2803949 RepID=A0A937F808_9BACT|nr:anthranilate synthase component I family protein [Fulvivirga sediminis]MBL3655683.1 anthranilate synthase component I family protein [Fulvivirga sediminis]